MELEQRHYILIININLISADPGKNNYDCNGFAINNMGDMMFGGSGVGFMIFGWVFSLLFVIILVLITILLIKQIQR